ncbi:acetyltransferase [Nocardia otitidiscaviarum]|uniref:Lysine N-acyltransferase MbtK n=1 Tax=Nocardia otitidiscaviarum TaxID=1823 RepID=A0A516NSE7_9NOCA|nr:GNAT family N-acetyltransferase [Nocardia otitidiscaviarum]MCP9621072.1 acetyltransferase [Nocardia otitidiscaviarum]QDP81830.1 acetyltransferase [Nocardia otitidiscaviarum]
MNRTYVLKRELTDIPENVRTAPAPVVPDFDHPFDLRIVDADGADPELITEWMHRPHLVETWEQDWPSAQRRDDCAAQLAGTFSRPCILGYDFTAADLPELGRQEVAYVELYRPAKDEIGTLYAADPRDMGFHIATAETKLIGRGVMSAWMRELATRVFAAEPECRRMMCDPDHRNVPMRRALTKNGWMHLGDFDIRPDRRISLYTLPRADGDVPTLR